MLKRGCWIFISINLVIVFLSGTGWNAELNALEAYRTIGEAVSAGNPETFKDATGGSSVTASMYSTATGAVKRKWGVRIARKWKVPKKDGGSSASGGGWNSRSSTGQDEVEGVREKYLLFCASCHGVNGDGEGSLADELEVPPRDHTDSSIMSERTDEEIFNVISLGGEETGFDNAMPSHKTVMPEKGIHELVAYIRKLCNCKYKGN